MASATYATTTQPRRPFHSTRSASLNYIYGNIDINNSSSSIPRSRSKSTLNINRTYDYDPPSRLGMREKVYTGATRSHGAGGIASSSEIPPKRSRTPAVYEEDTRRAHRRRTPVVVEDDFDDRPHHHQHNHGTGYGYTRSRTKSYSHLPTGSASSAHKDAYTTSSTRNQREDGYNHSQNNLPTFDFDSQVRAWMIQDEMRRMAAEREAIRSRRIQDEIRRTQAHLLIQREAERLRLLEEEMCLARGEEDRGRERARRQKASADRIMANAWMVYERNWATISSPSSSEPLSFANIPWPMLHRPCSPSTITLPAVAAFLLSETHSNSQKPKERIKEALRRWHPDRFVRFLRRVPLEERGLVEEAVGIVARCLNEMMGRYSE